MTMRRVVRAATFPFVAAVALVAAVPSAPGYAKSSGEIAVVSRLMSVKYEQCRQEANRQHLHLLARHRFLKECRAR
jgi:hypothetical protein